MYVVGLKLWVAMSKCCGGVPDRVTQRVNTFVVVSLPTRCFSMGVSYTICRFTSDFIGQRWGTMGVHRTFTIMFQMVFGHYFRTFTFGRHNGLLHLLSYGHITTTNSGVNKQWYDNVVCSFVGVRVIVYIFTFMVTTPGCLYMGTRNAILRVDGKKNGRRHTSIRVRNIRFGGVSRLYALGRGNKVYHRRTTNKVTHGRGTIFVAKVVFRFQKGTFRHYRGVLRLLQRSGVKRGTVTRTRGGGTSIYRLTTMVFIGIFYNVRPATTIGVCGCKRLNI